ncbi:hypothetical protein MVLG_00239 [Microbotryum lychnidis-dioicae p1A1 Lamole]|uniref:CLASP N-terminal domain-containing protein n=1 Tax=Microbotryum lychnidis-dioicae (strain p1A1 Lamole / MvSl-1064) TaxID=683840 RepID=U5GYH2_USTV1|nr:hypothetical protein MVLG_00239 [Microbotryum lychnidis-dioicae p1A1 Lamole]|eukprot:KDE09841.1 hypothetical protein MVLG_00239 [Microbotryum lychnidis-dioicae p1A1 Lamole]
MVKAPEPDRIPIASLAQLDHEFTLLQNSLAQSETEHTWENIDRAVKRFQAVVRGGAYKFTDEFIRRFKDKAISNGIVRSLATERTRLSASTLDLISSCTRLHGQFQPLLSTYLPPLLRLFCRTNKLYISRALSVLHDIIRHTLLVDILKFIVIEWKLESGKSSSFRIAAAEAVSAVLGAGTAELVVPKEALDKRVEEIEWVIRTGATDREAKVRGEIKKCWEVYKREWPDRVAQFTAPMTPISRKYLNVTAVGAPSTGQPSGPKPKVPLSLSLSVSGSSAPKKTTTAPQPSTFSHRPIPPTSSYAPSSSSASPTACSSSSHTTSSRPTPLSVSLYGGRPMPTGPLTSTTARDMRLAKSVGHGPPPPAISHHIEETARSLSSGALPSTTSSSASTWSASDYPTTRRIPRGPPMDAPIPSSSSSSTPHAPPLTSGAFKPSTASRSFRPNTASASQGPNVEVRRARRVAPIIAPPPVMRNVAPIGRPATLARHGGAASSGPFRPKSSRAPSASSTVVKPIEKRALVSSSVSAPANKAEPVVVAVSTKNVEEVQELERLVKIVDAGGVIVEDPTVDDEVLRSHLLDGLVEMPIAQGEADGILDGNGHTSHAVMDAPETEPTAVGVEVAPETSRVEAEAISAAEDPVQVLCGPTTRATVEPNSCAEAQRTTPTIVEISQEALSIAPEATEESIEAEPIPVAPTVSEVTMEAGELEREQEIEEPSECLEEPTSDAIRIVDLKHVEGAEETLEYLVAIAGDAEEETKAADEDEIDAPNAVEAVEAVEEELTLEETKDPEGNIEKDDTCDFDEHASTVEIEPLQAEGAEADEVPAAWSEVTVNEKGLGENEEVAEETAEIDVIVEERLDSEDDEDEEGPTFPLPPPTTPAKSSLPMEPFTPEPFAQTCSIMLDTPPRFEDFVSMAIRVPGALEIRMDELAQQPVPIEEEAQEKEELEEGGPEDEFDEHAQGEEYEDQAEEEEEEEEGGVPECLVSRPLSPSVRRVPLEKPHAVFEDEQSFSVDLSEDLDAAQMEEEDDHVNVQHDREVEVVNSPPTRYTYEHAPASIRSFLTHDDSSDDEDMDAPSAHARPSSTSPCDFKRSEAPIMAEEEVKEEEEVEVVSPVIFSRSLRSRVVEVLDVKAVVSPVKTRRGGRREVLSELR